MITSPDQAPLMSPETVAPPVVPTNEEVPEHIAVADSVDALEPPAGLQALANGSIDDRISSRVGASQGIERKRYEGPVPILGPDGKFQRGGVNVVPDGEDTGQDVLLKEEPAGLRVQGGADSLLSETPVVSDEQARTGVVQEQPRAALEGGYRHPQGDAELVQPRAPRREINVQNVDFPVELAPAGRAQAAEMISNGTMKDKSISEKFYRDAESFASRGRINDLPPLQRELYFQEIQRRRAADASYEMPEEVQELYGKWEETQQASNVPEAPAMSPEAEIAELQQAMENKTATDEQLDRLNELMREKHKTERIDFLQKELKTRALTDAEMTELKQGLKKTDGEKAEEPNIDKDIEDVQVEILKSMGNGELSAEEFAKQLDGQIEKFNKLMVVRGFENMGLSEEAARDIVQRSMSSELRGRLGQKNKEKIIQAREKIRELAAADLQLRSIKGRLDQAKDAQGKLLNLIRNKQRSYASYDNPNNPTAAAERMKLYGYMDRLAGVNEQVNRLKNASLVFVGDYRRTMADVRRSLGVTGFIGGFVEYSMSQVDQLEVNLMTNYRVVQAVSPLNPANR